MHFIEIQPSFPRRRRRRLTWRRAGSRVDRRAATSRPSGGNNNTNHGNEIWAEQRARIKTIPLCSLFNGQQRSSRSPVGRLWPLNSKLSRAARNLAAQVCLRAHRLAVAQASARRKQRAAPVRAKQRARPMSKPIKAPETPAMEARSSGRRQQKFYYHYYFHYQIIDELRSVCWRRPLCNSRLLQRLQLRELAGFIVMLTAASGRSQRQSARRLYSGAFGGWASAAIVGARSAASAFVPASA